MNKKKIMNSPSAIRVSVTVLSQMFLYLASLNVDVDGFLRSIGLDPLVIKAYDTRIPVETYLYIQDSAAEFVHDPCFGLHMGEFAEPGSWSILGYMLMNCSTLEEALEKSRRYSRIIGDLIETRPEPAADKLTLVFFTPPAGLRPPVMSRHCFDATFSTIVRLMRNLTGVRLSPLEVTFTYPAPASQSEYERIFSCPVRFGQEHNSISLDPRLGRTPVLLANPALLAHFEKYARDFLAAEDRSQATSAAVTRILLARLDDETMSIEKVAAEMSVSVRTLQNHLEAEGVVFSELLRQVRQQLAKQYLREDYSVEQITYLLGFSEPSVFRKAFKKWLGVTPKEYREHASAASSSI